MPSHRTTETFFRPDEIGRDPWQLNAGIYNHSRLLLSRSTTGSVFVPIRSMQYLGVIDAEEIVFVDSLGGYISRDGEGGRPILIAWRPRSAGDRPSLDAPVPCDVIHYAPDLADLQRRLVGEFGKSLVDLDRRYRDRAIPAQGARVVALNRR